MVEPDSGKIVKVVTVKMATEEPTGRYAIVAVLDSLKIATLCYLTANGVDRLSNRLSVGVSTFQTDDDAMTDGLFGKTAMEAMSVLAHIVPDMERVPAEAPDTRLADLAMLVKKLCRALQKADANSNLPGQAMDYLRRRKLQGSIFRES